MKVGAKGAKTQKKQITAGTEANAPVPKTQTE
jgi:hypothetical protein